MSDIPEWAVKEAHQILDNLKLRDPYTFYHCCRVGRSARRLAEAMGLEVYDQYRLEFTGLFHDVGKMGIPLSVLNKPTRLNQKEFELMKSHADLSVAIVEPLASKHEFFQSLLIPIEFHHERVDGEGYKKLEGDKVPLESRIIAVVDTVDAMLHTRAYREGLDFDTVKEELIEFSGSQFDKQIVKIYLQAIRFWKDIKQKDEEEFIIHHILPDVA